MQSVLSFTSACSDACCDESLAFELQVLLVPCQLVLLYGFVSLFDVVSCAWQLRFLFCVPLKGRDSESKQAVVTQQKHLVQYMPCNT